MTKTDLIEPRAKIEWANRQINILNGDLGAFFERNPYKFREEPNPEGGKDIFFEIVEPIPNIIQVDVGAILHAQRSSLDNLATVLAERNGHKNREDVYFPVGKTAQAATEDGFTKKIKRLSAADQAEIIALKPWDGGNIGLFALHSMNKKDKHRRLVTLGTSMGGLNITGNGHVRGFAVFVGEKPFESGTRIAFWDADEQINFNLSLAISFNEASGFSGKPLIEVLHEFSSLCNSIIDRFA